MATGTPGNTRGMELAGFWITNALYSAWTKPGS
jgi:hypothetical protein